MWLWSAQGSQGTIADMCPLLLTSNQARRKTAKHWRLNATSGGVPDLSGKDDICYCPSMHAKISLPRAELAFALGQEGLSIMCPAQEAPSQETGH